MTNGEISTCGIYSRIVISCFFHIILINFVDGKYVQYENFDFVPTFPNVDLNQALPDIDIKNIEFTPVEIPDYRINNTYTPFYKVYKNDEVPIKDDISKFSNTVIHPYLGTWEKFGESHITLPRYKGVNIHGGFGLGIGGGGIVVGCVVLRKCCKKEENTGDDHNSTNDDNDFQEDAVVIELPENMEDGTSCELGAETDSIPLIR